MNLFNIIKTFYLKLIVLTFFSTTNCDIDSEDKPIHGFSLDPQIDIDLELLAGKYLQSLKKVHNLEDSYEEEEEELDLQSDESVRIKRSPQIYPRRTDSFNDKGMFRLRSTSPIGSICSNPLDFTTTAFYGQKYGICLSRAENGRPARVSVGPITPKPSEAQWKTWIVKEPKNVVTFVDEDSDTKESNLFVLTADYGSRDGTDVVVINKHNQILTKEQHTVNSQYPTAIAVWKLRTDNTFHLAIANSYGRESTESYKSETFTFNWMQTYFDRYSEMTTYYVKDICPFNIHSNEFLAVANYMAGHSIAEVESEIFKLDIDRKKWRSFQRIQTFGAVDWEFFTLGANRREEYFLAVANSFDISHGLTTNKVNSIIYKFSGEQFVPFQCLSTFSATQIKTFRGIKGEFLLAVANMYESVHLYQYNGWKFIESTVQQTTGVMSPGVASIHFDYLPFERSAVMFVSNPKQPLGQMFRLEFVYENPLGQWYNKSLEWCVNTDKELDHSMPNLAMFLFKDVFYIDQSQPIVINGDLEFIDLNADSITTPFLIDQTNGDELSHRLIDELIKLNEEINGAEAMIGQINDILSNAMRTTGDQLITASHVFKSVDFDCKPEFDCYFGNVDTNVLNYDNVFGLSDDIIPLNTDQDIAQPIHFQNLRVDQNLKLNGLINGINPSDIVTKTQSHDIIGSKTFINDLTANEVVVNHLINQKIINPSTVLLTIGDQIINNNITFTDNIQISNLQVNGLVNGINIEKFFSQVITKDGNHIIRDTKNFNEIEIYDLLMKNGATIDGIDIMRLWNDVLWTYGDQVIETPINFTDIIIDGNLIVDGLINNIKIPNDIVLTHESQTIYSNTRFLMPIKFNTIEILHSINGIGLVDRQLDLLLKSRIQTVLGQKVVTALHLGGHSLVRGTVDGVKLSQLQRSLLYRNTTQHFDVLNIEGNAFFDGELALKHTINGIKLEDLYNKALKLTDKHIPAFPNFQLNYVNIKSLDCQSINGLNIGIDLMTKNTPQIISGQKKFFGGIKIKDNINVKFINGIDLDFINDTLLYDTEQYISGEKTFVNGLQLNHLKVNSINNISMNDIVLLNRDEVITAPKIFTDIKIFGDLSLHSLESDIINGVHLKELFYNTLKYDKHQIISVRLNFDSILIPKGTNLETNYINGVNLRQLLSDAVLTDVDQTITGAKTFMAPITIERLNFLQSFDNVTDYDMKYNWLLQDSSQTINSDIFFDQTLRVDDNILMRTPIINKIDLNFLNNNSVKTDEPAIIRGETKLLGPVYSGHIKLNGRIQGIDLDKEAVLLNGNSQIKGLIHFANGFEVDEHIYVKGTVDGVKVEELCKSVVRKHQNNLMTGQTVVMGDVIIKGSLNVNEGINGMNIEGFSRSVLKVDEPMIVKDIKKFHQLVIDGPVSVNRLIGGFDINYLYNNYMSLSRDQIINSPIVFVNDLIMKNLNINGSVWTQNALINGIDLHLLDSTVLKTYGNQLITGEFSFENNVFFDKDLNIVHRIINGLHLTNDLMIRGRNNVITTPKVFTESIVVHNNLNIKDMKTIGGVDISELAKFSVMKNDGNYIIDGNKHFTSLEVDHLTVGRINGIEMSDKNLLLNYGKQTINGIKVLERDLVVNSQINSNTVNNINIPYLSENLVLKGYNNSINSVKTFKSPLSGQNVWAFGRVDGVDLNELNYFIGLPVDLLDLRMRLGIEDRKILSMERVLEQQSIELAYYQLVSTIHSGPVLLSYHNIYSGSQTLFITGRRVEGCQEIDVYSLTNNGIKSFTKIYAIEAILMSSFIFNGQQFVIVSNSISNPISDKCLRRNHFSILSEVGTGPAVNQVFAFDEKLNIYRQIALVYSNSVTDIKVIDDHYSCLLLVTPITVNRHPEHTMVLCLDKNFHFYLKKTSLSGIDQISVIKSHSFNRTLMASIKSWESYSDLSISEWSSQVDHTIQNIQFFSPSAVHLVEIPTHSSLFLFVSQKKTSSTHSPLVRIFRYNHQRVVNFIEVQQIKGSEVIQIESIYLDKNKVLIFMLTSDRLDLYRLKGSSGFVRIDSINVENAQNFIVSNVWKFNGIPNHLIAISFKECYTKNRNICKEETHVLISKFNTN